MAGHLIRRLEHFVALSPEDRTALRQAVSSSGRTLAPREDVACEGDRPTRVSFVLEGLACRYKTLVDGRRQIVALLVPGDLCDYRMTMLRRMDNSIGAVGPVRVGWIEPEAIAALEEASHGLRQALWCNALVGEAIAREWAVSLGQRSATERLAHLFASSSCGCRPSGS